MYVHIICSILHKLYFGRMKYSSLVGQHQLGYIYYVCRFPLIYFQQVVASLVAASYRTRDTESRETAPPPYVTVIAASFCDDGARIRVLAYQIIATFLHP